MKWKWIALILLLVPVVVYAAQNEIGSGAGVYWSDVADDINDNFDELYTDDAALGTASTRDAEDTLTDGANLPDGAAIKAYGDSNWSDIVEDTTPELGGPLDLNGELVYDGTGIDDDDCTGDQGKYWWDSTDNQWEFCNANSGTPIVIGSGTGSQTPWTQDIDTAGYEMADSTGSVTVGDNLVIERDGESEAARIETSSDAGQYAGLSIFSASSYRWAFGKTTTAETGSDAGSNVSLDRYSDAGSWQGAVFLAYRDTGAFELGTDLVFNEESDHVSTPAAGYGYLWTKNTTPSTLIFTDDAGTDTTLGSGGALGDDIQLDDMSDHSSTPSAGTGIIWIEDASPVNKPRYTDEDGDDWPLMTNLADDPDPDLGDDLDVGAYKIESTSGNVDVQLPDNGGTYMFRILDSDGNAVWCVDSNGSTGC